MTKQKGNGFFATLTEIQKQRALAIDEDRLIISATQESFGDDEYRNKRQTDLADQISAFENGKVTPR